MRCELAHQDGAYVLGALSPAERLEFEEHLAGCADCARAVRELAGLPGLLARVDATALQSPLAEEPVPDTLLPALVRRVRRRRRRRLLVASWAAAAAVVAVVAVPLAVTGGSDDGTPTAPRRSMVAIGGAPVRASVAFEQVPWGTRLDLTCTYAPEPERYHLPRVATYVLLVRTRDGSTQQVGTWRSLEGRTMRLTAATSASRGEIASVEVRTTDGKAVLELAG
jgi:anti-sigma-K factor RskA